MISLPLTFNKNRCFYKQVIRTENVAMCSLSYSAKGAPVGFEVFMVRIQPAGKAFGKDIPEHEHIPSNEEFGSTAWSYTTRETAMQKFDELTKPCREKGSYHVQRF